MNILERLCPYCSDVMEIEDNLTDWYGLLIYGTCENCMVTFVKQGVDDEWAEAAEQHWDND